MSTAKDILDELTFRSYVYQRTTFPHVSVERWRIVYADHDVEELEARYQRELTLSEQKGKDHA